MADPILISLQCTDANGAKTSVPVYMPSTSTLAEINATAVGHATALDAVSGCKVTAAFVTLPLDISTATIKGAPDDDAVTTEGHRLVFSATGTSHTWGVRIPYVKRTFVDGRVMNDEHATVTALHNAYTQGIAANPDPSDPEGRDLLAFVKSKHSPGKG